MNASSPRRTHPAAPRRGATTFVAIVVVILTMVGAVVYFATRGGGAAAGSGPILIAASETEFISQVLDQGEIQSSENIEIRCDVRPAGGSIAVIEVIPEGTMIINTKENPRDKELVLVRLDSKAFEKELETQKLAVNSARTMVIQAEAAWEASKVARREYIEGIYVQNRKQIENEIYNAQQETKQAEAYLDYSTKLHAKNFITTQQLEGDRIAVQRARNSYDLAVKKLQVLDEVSKEKELIKLDSEIRAAEVKYSNDQEKLKIEEDKLAEIELQIKNCTIYPPPGVSGQVVYNKETGRGGQTDWVLTEGATVRERQVLIRIPNPDKMEVKALINEQSITAVNVGMPVSIKVDALHGTQLKGEVTSVSQYAQSDGWFSSSIKKYPVLVKIFDPPEALKPGMNSSVAIQTMFREKAVQVPVQCIYAAQDSLYCLVKRGEAYETVEVTIGGTNSKYACIESGVSDGDVVVMNPGGHRDLLDIPAKTIDGNIELPPGEQFVSAESEGASPVDGPAASAEAAVDSAAQPGPPNSGDGQARGGREGRGGPGGGQGGGRGFGGSPEQAADGMLSRMDTNADQILDESELSQLPGGFGDRIRSSDSDGDGKITRDELVNGMRRMMESMQSSGGPGGAPGGGR